MAKLEIQILAGDADNQRELYVWDGTLLLGSVVVSWDSTCGYCGSFEVKPGARFGAAYHLIGEAARVLTEAGVPGVLIHAEGVNRTRKFYARLGFVSIEQIPGLMVARMSEINGHMKRESRRQCAGRLSAR